MGLVGVLAYLVLTLVFAVQTCAQSYDPLTDFCRRFAHQTTIIDRKLYIDGGLVNYDTIQENPSNYTNTWLLYADLDEIENNFPVEHDNLTKGSYVPSVQGGILWADTVNKIFYQYGGEYYQTTPQPFALWSYDTIYNQWNETSDTSSVVRASFGAGVTVDDRALGYYYGGWLSNWSIPSWSGDPMAISTLLIYDMIENQWTNSTGPDDTPRAEGAILYIPASDAGMLVYFGGIRTPFGSGNGTTVGESMNNIYLYDIASQKWYTQTATGDTPDMRRRFCAGVTWSEDQSSYNVYIYGGLSVPKGAGFNDVYILSIPSFTWIQWWTANDTEYSHHSLTCNVVDGAQMIIMGGTYPNNTQDCDSPSIWGMHNLNLGQKDVADAEWYQFLPNVTSYQVPADITAAVGGGATGGATLTTPTSGWDNDDLAVYFTRKYASTTRTPTRYIPSTNTASTTPTPTHTSTSINVGAIAGGTVGGVVFLAACFLTACLCLRRRKKRRTAAEATQPAPMAPPVQPMRTLWRETAELDSVNPISEISDHERNKPPYHVDASAVSPPPGYTFNHSRVWQGQGNASPGHPYRPELQGQQYFPPPIDTQMYFPHPPPPPPPQQLEMPTIRSPVSAHGSQHQSEHVSEVSPR